MGIKSQEGQETSPNSPPELPGCPSMCLGWTHWWDGAVWGLGLLPKPLGLTWCRQDGEVLAVRAALTQLFVKPNGSNLREENLVACTLDLLFAGTETTSTTIRWALLYMAIYPEIQGTVSNGAVLLLGFNSHSSMGDSL